MKRYANYKDSGIDWLGEIPAHWEVKKGKYIFKLHSGNGFPHEFQGNNDGKIPFLKVSDINGEEIFIKNSSNRVTNEQIKKNNWNLVPKNSIVTAKIGEALRKNHRKVTFVDSVIDNNCVGIESINIYPLFNYYAHKVINFDWFVNPGAVPSISIYSYRNLKIPLPPLPEQQAIADYLDKKTELIAQAIANYRQQIDKLKEYKTALINQVVTKGLNPNVAYKNSGIDWLGEIPAHWKVSPGFTVLRENKNLNSNLTCNVVLSLSYGRIVIKPEEKLTGLVPESFEGYQLIEPNDIIIRCTDLQNDKISLRVGLSYYGGIITNAYLGLKAIYNNYSKYLYLYLHVLDTTKNIYRLGKGLRQNLSFNDIKRLPVLVPPLAEQQQIAAYLDKKTAEIDQAIKLKQQQIDKLGEYKTSLINQVVTGKIKVS